MTEQVDSACRTAGFGGTTTPEGIDCGMAPLLAHPEDILADPTLSKEQQRSILASWLSDEHAVPDAPRWRQLQNGAFVDVEDIWKALRVLDDAEFPKPSRRRSGSHPSCSWRRKSTTGRLSGILRRKRSDDDDDASPTLAGMRPPHPAPNDGSIGSGAELGATAA